MSDQEPTPYDVFISYSHKDATWVRGVLLPNLEKAGLRACIDYRDFEIGAPVVTEMQRAVVTSRKTLLILTPEYLDSAWTEFENLMLQTFDPANRKRRLIGLLKETCGLPLRLGYLTYVNFAEPADPDRVWTQLFAALGAPSAETPPDAPEALGAAPRRAAEAETLLRLRQALLERSKVSDLRDLCFAMGIDYENYPSAKDQFVRDLLYDLERRGQVERFVEIVREHKPWVLGE
jgi:hypothetical protein